MSYLDAFIEQKTNVAYFLSENLALKHMMKHKKDIQFLSPVVVCIKYFQFQLHLVP